MKTHHATLLGYFLGPRLHFLVVQSYLKTAWGKYGFVYAMMNNNGVYFLKFNDEGGVYHFLSPWDPLKGLSKPVHNSCPLWITLHNISFVAFNREGISRIASALGVPKQMDACTSLMCDKAWGCPGFAKVLVEVSVIGDLKWDLEVVIPSLSGGEDAKASSSGVVKDVDAMQDEIVASLNNEMTPQEKNNQESDNSTQGERVQSGVEVDLDPVVPTMKESSGQATLEADVPIVESVIRNFQQ
ncbi:hypothetical protein OSB04_028360 [Centaurea solstitialis]|uniref:DUF4283 domain-containing protein n=1 Tax=Centaurea solstitialis TaxID=347529 RepID=A0AA38SH31_9ASTR|nr:hypothetical protein OSB04_028360 [Centaurea solstitialis]